MSGNDFNSQFLSLSQTYELAGESMKEHLRSSIDGEEINPEEFTAMVQRRLTSKDAMEALVKFSIKEEKNALNEFH